VNLSWSASTDDTGVTGYRVYRDGTLLTTLTGTATTYADATVTPNTTYGYQVTALDAAGNESARQQTPVTVTTPGQTDTQAPTPPGNLAATAPSGTQVNLTWTASTDDIGVDHYEVARSGTALAPASGAATTYTDEAAAPGTTYTYSLRAVDAAGNRSTAGTVVVTTPAGAGTSSATFAALADASVKQASATSNFGTTTSLNSDSGSGVAMESYLRFNVTTVGAKTVQSAKLRLYVPSDGTSDGPGVYACTDPACATWTESGITWNSRPPRAGTPTSDVGAITAGRYVEWDVTPLISHDGTYTLVVGPTPTTDGTVFSSDEATTNKPQLVVTTN
jgi:chitodextrinase